MSKTDGGLLLDTHAWIWLSVGLEKRMKPALLDHIEEAARNDLLRISAITPWEIAVLHRKNRIRLSEDLLDWIRTTIRRTRVQVLPLLPEIAVESERLPGAFHGDPADRIIAATAIASQSSLVTADREILRYGKQGRFSVEACG